MQTTKATNGGIHLKQTMNAYKKQIIHKYA